MFAAWVVSIRLARRNAAASSVSANVEQLWENEQQVRRRDWVDGVKDGMP